MAWAHLGAEGRGRGARKGTGPRALPACHWDRPKGPRRPPKVGPLRLPLPETARSLRVPGEAPEDCRPRPSGARKINTTGGCGAKTPAESHPLFSTWSRPRNGE